jgi:X-X-X-Leu-X-X-Gly heptad repeat protein
MSHAARRPLTAAVVATCSLALIGAPTAGAKPRAKTAKTKVSKVDKAQNSAIRKVNRTANSANRTARSAAQSAAAGLAAANAAAKKADGAQGGVNAVIAGVPQITDSLRQLASGLTSAAAGLTQLKDGVTQLKDGLTAVGDGVTTLGDAFVAQEYGTVQVQLGSTDVPGTVLNSGDIPDDGNGATLTGTVIVPVPAGATAAPIRLMAGVRSGEADGNGADDPVASAGIVSMVVSDPTGGGVTLGGGNTGLPRTVPLTSAPNAALGGAPVYDIPDAAPRSDDTPNPFSFPDADQIELTDPTTLYNLSGVGVSRYTVTNGGATPVPITVTFTVRFNDLTASATDPTA